MELSSKSHPNPVESWWPHLVLLIRALPVQVHLIHLRPGDPKPNGEGVREWLGPSVPGGVPVSCQYHQSISESHWNISQAEGEAV